MDALLPHCKLIPSDDSYANVYQMNLKNEFTDENFKLRRLSFGPSVSTAPMMMKTILVMGETGSGKSTLINALTNYLFGVQFEDEHRFRLVSEDLEADQTRSVTDWVTAYVLYHQDTFPKEFPYSLKIVDTPGFGDTAGKKRDDIITEQLTKFFTTKGSGGIDSLDALGFVVRNSTTRLTEREKYIFNSVLKLFGNDITNNIVPLLTFAEDSGLCSGALALDAMKADKIPYAFAIACNNGCLFDATKNYRGRQKTKKGIQWEERGESFETLVTKLCDLEPRSLVLAKEVLLERKRLETKLTGIREQVVQCLKKQAILHENEQKILKNMKLMEEKKDYNTELEEQIQVLVDLKPGKTALICTDCKTTCHSECGCAGAVLKWSCTVMSTWTPLSVCTVCPNRCSWTKHTIFPQRYETRTVRKSITCEEMKTEYEKASNDKFTIQGYITKLQEEIEDMELHTLYLVGDVRATSERLDEIAMRPCTLKNKEQYLDNLIEMERSEGNQSAALQLVKIRDASRRLETNAKSAGITNIHKTLNNCIDRGLGDEKPTYFIIKMFRDIKNMIPGLGIKYQNSYQ